MLEEVLFSQKKIDLLILPDLHVLKVRIQKNWFFGVDMSVCLSAEYLDLAVF